MMAVLARHWQLVLAAAAVGLVLGAVFVLVYYLAVPIRLRLAPNPEVRARILEGELAWLRRLGDEAAIYQEHGLAGAGELRQEAELRGLVLQLALRRAGRVNPSVRG